MQALARSSELDALTSLPLAYPRPRPSPLQALGRAALARAQELDDLKHKMQELANKMQEDEEAMECSVCFEVGGVCVLFPPFLIPSLSPSLPPTSPLPPPPDGSINLTPTSEPASTALIPCGHCFCCSPGCASHDVEICPSCRTPIQSRTVLFGALQPASQHAHLVNLAASLGEPIAKSQDDSGSGQNESGLGGSAGGSAGL